MENGKPTNGRRPARARWVLDGWIRDIGDDEARAVAQVVAGSRDEGHALAVERLALECAAAHRPAQGPAPEPGEWGCPGFCAALPADAGRWGW